MEVVKRVKTHVSIGDATAEPIVLEEVADAEKAEVRRYLGENYSTPIDLRKAIVR